MSEAISVYPPDLADVGTRQHMMFGDEGFIRPRNAAVTGLVGVAAFAILAFANRGGFGFTSDAEESYLKLKAIDVSPMNVAMRSMSVFEGTGESKQKFQVGGKNVEFTGYGSKVEEGSKFALMLGIKDGEILEKNIFDAETQTATKYVGIYADTLVTNTQTIYPDTRVTAEDPALSQFGIGAGNIISSVLKVGCNAITFGQKQDKCNVMNFLADYNDDKQAELQSATLAEVQEQVATTGAEAEWEAQKAAILQSYEDEFVAAGGDRTTFKAEFINRDGTPFVGVPDFSNADDVLDDLRKRGILQDEDTGMQVDFGKVTVTPSDCKYDANATTDNKLICPGDKT